MTLARLLRFPDGPSRGARPLLVADWTDAVFVHFALEPHVLQPHVPFELDLHEGKAYVSLVAFTQERLRPRTGGRLSAALSAPLATHHFLNVRTYVRVGDRRGIYFLREWIPNRLAALLGPTLYGLPYRLARLDYRRRRDERFARHEIAAGSKLVFDASWNGPGPPQPVCPNTLDAFLLERYLAFTWHGGVARCFQVWHDPWPQYPARATMRDVELLKRLPLPGCAWAPVAAHYSPGARNVALSQPTCVSTKPPAEPGAAPDLRGDLGPLLLLLLLALTIVLAHPLPPWQFMWLLALSLYGGCKFLTWWPFFLTGRAPPGRSIGYLFAWVGMNAQAFLGTPSKPLRPTPSEWLKAGATTSAGAIVLWAVCRLIPAAHPLLVGWAGMIGLTLLLHFGSFHLLSLLWRRAGIDAPPLMNRPLTATSLAGFWGRRWNTAFHALANRLVFRPLLRRVGLPGAVLGTFLASGLIHDLIISLPARGGFGLPTAYFALQGVGVLLERRIGRGRAMTMLFTLAPVCLLFHPPFITRVILPFLTAIRAIPGDVS